MRPVSFGVALLVLVCAISTYDWDVRAATPPERPQVQNASPMVTGAVRGTPSTRTGDPGFLRPGSHSPRIEPTPLPTPVAPTEGWKGYVVPPPPPPPPPPVVTVQLLRGDGWPVTGPLTQGFSPWHQGIDLAVPCGTPVADIGDGRVIWSGWKTNGGGLVVDVRLDNGYTASFNHLSLSYVAPGQRVVRGQAIAASGTSGNSTGCHLHLGIQAPNGNWVDPLGYLT